jgi:hypothetical protein
MTLSMEEDEDDDDDDNGGGDIALQQQNGYTNAPQCDVTHTLPMLLNAVLRYRNERLHRSVSTSDVVRSTASSLAV